MIRKVGFKYHLMRDGAFYGYLRAVTSTTPTINMDDSREIKTSFSAEFAPVAFDADNKPLDINWLTDEIQPVLIIDGVDYPLGVFMPAKVEHTKKQRSKRIKVQCFDRCWRVRDTRSDELLYWPAGTLYIDAIKQLLAASGLNTVFAVPSDAAFTSAREDWKLGESFLKVCNDLLKEINYKPLWFNSYGFAVLEPVSVPTTENIKYTFNLGDSNTRVYADVTRTSDIYESPNVFIVYCANPDKSGNMVAVAANENPQSPLSVQRRGRQIVSCQQVNNIASQSELDAYAAWLRNKSLMTGETIKAVSGLIPGLGVTDAVGFIDDEENIAVIGLLHAYTMPLTVGGEMRHSIERIVYNLE